MSNLEPAKQIPGLEVYPKMVYPGWDGEGMAPPAETAVMVADEEQEKWVNDGNKLDDFGKPPKQPKKAADWTAPKA